MKQKDPSANLTSLARGINIEPSKPESGKTEIGSAENQQVEYAHGERGDFVKITVTVPPDVYAELVQESARRKIAREPNRLVVDHPRGDYGIPTREIGDARAFQSEHSGTTGFPRVPGLV